MNDLFGPLSSDDDEGGVGGAGFTPQFEEREVTLAGAYSVRVRESSFSPTNANVAWPSNSVMATWLLENKALLEGKRILDLGAGVGVLVSG